MKVKTIIAGVSALTMVAYSMPLSMIDMNQMIVSAAEAADNVPKIEFDTEITGRPGKKVKVNVYLSNYEKSVFDSFSLRWNHDKELKCMEVPGENAVIASTEKFAQAIYSSDGIEVETNREKLFTVAYVIPEDAKPGTEYKLSWADTNEYNFVFLNTAASKNNIECKLTDGVIRVVADNNSDTGTDKTPDNSSENLPLVLGDVNLDGKVDITDLSILSISLVDKKPLSEKAQKTSDVNRDNEVDLTDLATIKQYVSKIIDSFDVKPDDADNKDNVQETADWRKLYTSKLNEYTKSSDAMFDLVDMNGDSIPELLVSDGTMHPARVTIYSVNENSLTELGSYGEYGIVSYNPTIGRIRSRWMNQGIIDSVYYKMEKNELVKIYSSSTNAGAVASKDQMYFKINGENVTAEEYEKIESENSVDGWDGYGRKYKITADVISKVLG